MTMSISHRAHLVSTLQKKLEELQNLKMELDHDEFRPHYEQSSLMLHVDHKHLHLPVSTERQGKLRELLIELLAEEHAEITAQIEELFRSAP